MNGHPQYVDIQARRGRTHTKRILDTLSTYHTHFCIMEESSTAASDFVEASGVTSTNGDEQKSG